jgi:hypothetical protein
MNRQFFGDTRDLFKYDLVRHIMKALPLFDSFTFIPMLTEEEPVKKKSTARDFEKATKHGRAGSQNQDLIAHMERLQEIDDDLEYFQTVGAYFRKENILVDILDSSPFSHEKRARYFNNITAHLPKKSLIFLDPDIGLEESRPSKKHLLFDEVKKIFGRMDTKSALMIYQHFPREKRDVYIRRRCTELHDLTGTCPVTITDNEIVFFFLVDDPRLQEKLEGVLSLYADTYPVLNSGTCQ